MRTLAMPLAFVIALAAACDGGGDDNVHTGAIASMRQPCTGEADLLCLRMATDGGPVETFHSSIDGFTFKWGVRSSITFTRTEIENPIPDEGLYDYALETIVAEAWDPVGTRYTLHFHGSDAWFVRRGANLMMRDTEVECAPALCDQILAGQAEAHDILFELTADPFVPLRALSRR
jgi:hypothetical protein